MQIRIRTPHVDGGSARDLTLRSAIAVVAVLCELHACLEVVNANTLLKFDEVFGSE